jgi:glutathione S-transferase
MILYGESNWDSPFVFTAYVTLMEKHLPFTVKALDLHAREHHDAEFRERSMTGKVPTLEHDGFYLSESLAIVEYLEEALPEAPHVLPRGVKERARARQIMGWLRSEVLVPLRKERPTSTIFLDERANASLSNEGRAAAERLFAMATRLLEGRTTLFGSWSIADAELSLMLQRLLMNGDEVPPSLAAHANATWARPSIAAFRSRTPGA